jgi:hypothetical protein
VIVQGIPVVISIPQPSAGASSSSSSGASPDHDSVDDYPDFGGSTYWNCSKEGHLIYMVPPNVDPSRNNTSRHPTIGRSGAFDARTPNAGLVQNLNPDFNVVWFQMILESIQLMAPKGSPIIALAQQGLRQQFSW